MTWKFDGAVGSAGGGRPKYAGDSARALDDHHFIAATFPSTVVRVTFKAGIATGAWDTVTTCSPHGGLATSVSYGGTSWNVAFTDAIETKESETVIHASHSRTTPASDPRHDDWEKRVVAVNLAGEEIRGSGANVLNDQITTRFIDLPLAQVKEFRFQARPYQWVVFRDVPLEPARETPSR